MRSDTSDPRVGWSPRFCTERSLLRLSRTTHQGPSTPSPRPGRWGLRRRPSPDRQRPFAVPRGRKGCLRHPLEPRTHGVAKVPRPKEDQARPMHRRPSESEEHGKGLDAHVHVARRVRRPARRQPGRVVRLVLGRRRRGAERPGGDELLGRRRERPDAARADVGMRRDRRRPPAVRPDRRLGRQPSSRRARGRRDAPTAARGFHDRGSRGRRSPAASRTGSERRRPSPATGSSRSPAPTSSSRRSTSASSTRSASARCPCCSAPASATSVTSSAITSCSTTRSWCRASGRCTSATPSVAESLGRISTSLIRSHPVQERAVDLAQPPLPGSTR